MEFPEDFKNKRYGKGSLLIANPVLPDPNFSRTVICYVIMMNRAPSD